MVAYGYIYYPSRTETVQKLPEKKKIETKVRLESRFMIKYSS